MTSDPRAILNPIPTGCCHVTLIYGLIPPIAGRNRVNACQTSLLIITSGTNSRTPLQTTLEQAYKARRWKSDLLRVLILSGPNIS